MKILLTAMHYPVASGRYMLDALKRAGHDVHTAGPAMHCTMWGQTWDERYAWIPDAPVKDWQPDLVLHMDGNWAPPERLHDCLHVVYGVDNHVRDYIHFPANAVTRDDWDHVFFAHKLGAANDNTRTWLPCAYDPAQHTPGLPYAERQIDVAMLAVPYGPRETLKYAVLSQINPINFAYGLSIFDGYVGTYQRAKVSLVRSAAGDVAQRVFETAAMGCLVVMDVCADADELGLVHGENCLMYQTDAQAVDLLQFALSNSEEAARIATAGQAWAFPHTWDARAATITNQQKPKSAPKKREKAVENE